MFGMKSLSSPLLFFPVHVNQKSDGLFQIGVDVSRTPLSDAGPVLAEAIRKFLYALDLPDGLAGVGYGRGDVGRLVEGTLPQVSFSCLRYLWRMED